MTVTLMLLIITALIGLTVYDATFSDEAQQRIQDKVEWCGDEGGQVTLDRVWGHSGLGCDHTDLGHIDLAHVDTETGVYDPPPWWRPYWDALRLMLVGLVMLAVVGWAAATGRLPRP